MYHGIKMKPEDKSEWVNALRSGNYKKGRNALKSENEVCYFCCLGVFATIKGVSSSVGETAYVFDFDQRQDMSTLPTEWFSQFFDVESDKDETSKEDILKDIKSDLIELNDGQDYSFNQIADWIEANL